MLGTAIEWYDYFVYGIIAALVFDRLFFPELSPTAGAAAALASFAVGFIARPIGAAAPVLLVILRLLEGLSVGGEWSGAVLCAASRRCSYIGARAGDRFGPGKTVAAGSALTALAAWPLVLWVGSAQPVAVVLGIGIAIGLVGIPYGPLGAMMADAFATETRYSAVAVSYNVAGVIGGLVPSLAAATTAAAGGAIWSVAALLSAIMAISAIGAVLLAVRHAPPKPATNAAGP